MHGMKIQMHLTLIANDAPSSLGSYLLKHFLNPANRVSTSVVLRSHRADELIILAFTVDASTSSMVLLLLRPLGFILSGGVLSEVSTFIVGESTMHIVSILCAILFCDL